MLTASRVSAGSGSGVSDLTLSATSGDTARNRPSGFSSTANAVSGYTPFLQVKISILNSYKSSVITFDFTCE